MECSLTYFTNSTPIHQVRFRRTFKKKTTQVPANVLRTRLSKALLFLSIHLNQNIVYYDFRASRLPSFCSKWQILPSIHLELLDVKATQASNSENLSSLPFQFMPKLCHLTRGGKLELEQLILRLRSKQHRRTTVWFHLRTWLRDGWLLTLESARLGPWEFSFQQPSRKPQGSYPGLFSAEFPRSRVSRKAKKLTAPCLLAAGCLTVSPAMSIIRLSPIRATCSRPG